MLLWSCPTLWHSVWWHVAARTCIVRLCRALFSLGLLNLLYDPNHDNHHDSDNNEIWDSGDQEDHKVHKSVDDRGSIARKTFFNLCQERVILNHLDLLDFIYRKADGHIIHLVVIHLKHGCIPVDLVFHIRKVLFERHHIIQRCGIFQQLKQALPLCIQGFQFGSCIIIVQCDIF